MKYIIDLDALKNCMDFMQNHGKTSSGDPLVGLGEIKEFIDAFPKTLTEYHIPLLTINTDLTCGAMGKLQDTGDEKV